MTAAARSDSLHAKRPLVRPVFWWLLLVPVVVLVLGGMLAAIVSPEVIELKPFVGGCLGGGIWALVGLSLSALAFRLLALTRRGRLVVWLMMLMLMAFPAGGAVALAGKIAEPPEVATVWHVLWITAGAWAGMLGAMLLVFRRRSGPRVGPRKARLANGTAVVAVAAYGAVWFAAHLLVGGRDLLTHAAAVSAVYAGSQAFSLFRRGRAFAAADGMAARTALAAMLVSAFVHDVGRFWWHWPLSQALLLCVAGYLLALTVGHVVVFALLGPLGLLGRGAAPLGRRLPSWLGRRRTVAWSIGPTPAAEAASSPETAQSRPAPARAPLLQFRLRTLIAVTLCLAVLCGWIAIQVQRGRDQERAIEAIVAAGGSVSFDYGGDAPGIPGLSLNVTPPAPEWLRNQLGEHFFATVDEVWLRCAPGQFDVAHLRDLRCLSSLGIDSTPLAGDQLAEISDIGSLEELSLALTPIGDEEIRHLARLKRLRSLDLDFTAVTDDSIEVLGRLPRLVDLSLCETLVSEDAFRRLNAMHAWESLDYLPAPSDAHRRAAVALAQHGALVISYADTPWGTGPGRVVGLDGALWNGTVQDIKPLAQLDELTYLRIENCPFAAEALKSAQGITKLDSLVLIDGTVDDAQLAALAPLTNLQRLRLDCPNVTDAGLAHLAGMKGLKSLMLGPASIDGSGLHHLRAAENLDMLGFCSTPLSDEGLSHVAQLPKLKELDLDGTAVTNAGLRHLAELSELETLRLAGPQITDAGLSHLKGLSKLRHLDLSGTAVTGPGLVHLETLEHLESVILEGTPVTAASVKRLQAALPDAQIETGVPLPAPLPPLPPPPASAPLHNSGPASEEDP